MNPVHQKENGNWCFWDEIWCNEMGDYKIKEDAEQGLKEYCKWLNYEGDKLNYGKKERIMSKVWKCLICGKPQPEYVPVYCCKRNDCNCQGVPLNPCACSSECEKAIFHGIGSSFEQRRKRAGIAKWINPHENGDVKGEE